MSVKKHQREIHENWGCNKITNQIPHHLSRQTEAFWLPVTWAVQVVKGLPSEVRPSADTAAGFGGGIHIYSPLFRPRLPLNILKPSESQWITVNHFSALVARHLWRCLSILPCPLHQCLYARRRERRPRRWTRGCARRRCRCLCGNQCRAVAPMRLGAESSRVLENVLVDAQESFDRQIFRLVVWPNKNDRLRATVLLCHCIIKQGKSSTAVIIQMPIFYGFILPIIVSCIYINI